MTDPLDRRIELEGRLAAEHLKGVEEDEAAVLALAVERARLVLYGSLAAAAGSLTAAWGSERAVCTDPFGTAIVLLWVGAGLAWNSLQWSSIQRSRRVARKFKTYERVRSVMFTRGPDSEHAVSEEDHKAAWAKEASAGNVAMWLTTAGYSVSGFGAAFLVWGAWITLRGTACWTYAGAWQAITN